MVAADLGADSIAPRTRPPLETLDERLDASPPRAAPQRSCIVVVAVVVCEKRGREKRKSLLLSSRKGGEEEEEGRKSCGEEHSHFSLSPFPFFPPTSLFLFFFLSCCLPQNDGSRVDGLAFLSRSGERGSVELSISL